MSVSLFVAWICNWNVLDELPYSKFWRHSLDSVHWLVIFTYVCQSVCCLTWLIWTKLRDLWISFVFWGQLWDLWSCFLFIQHILLVMKNLILFFLGLRASYRPWVLFVNMMSEEIISNVFLITHLPFLRLLLFSPIKWILLTRISCWSRWFIGRINFKTVDTVISSSLYLLASWAGFLIHWSRFLVKRLRFSIFSFTISSALYLYCFLHFIRSFRLLSALVALFSCSSSLSEILFSITNVNIIRTTAPSHRWGFEPRPPRLAHQDYSIYTTNRLAYFPLEETFIDFAFR